MYDPQAEYRNGYNAGSQNGPRDNSWSSNQNAGYFAAQQAKQQEEFLRRQQEEQQRERQRREEQQREQERRQLQNKQLVTANTFNPAGFTPYQVATTRMPSQPLTTKQMIGRIIVVALLLVAIVKGNEIGVAANRIGAYLDKHPPAALVWLFDLLRPIPPGERRNNQAIAADIQAAKMNVLSSNLAREEQPILKTIVSSRQRKNLADYLQVANQKYVNFLSANSEDLLAGGVHSQTWSAAIEEHRQIQHSLLHLKYVAAHQTH